jgi:hypothetical protein
MSYSYPHAAEALQLLASVGILKIQTQSVPNSKEKAPSVYTLEQNVLRLEPTAFTKCPRLPNNSQELPKNGSSDVSEKRACRPASSSIQIVDDHHISELGKIFTPASVAKAVASCRAWLLTPKGTGKAFSKRRLQTFLRDAEPIGAPATPPHQSTRQDIIRHSTPARIIKSINP